jgi:hypothetical protein
MRGRRRENEVRVGRDEGENEVRVGKDEGEE